ncbi:MAG TPA: NUDIX hydrolase [Candidatus Ozemobacteraceae bacterium]|nr:NUDIX hydrolase [Candidatus Ozemobacteraceae bacterium]
MVTTQPVNIRIRVTILVQRPDGRVCLVRHLKDGRRYWLLPGGGQEPFECMTETARRELWEETRIACGQFEFLGLRESFASEAGRHIVYPVFRGLNPDFSAVERGEDARVEAVDFLTWEEIRERTVFPEMKTDLERLVRGEPILPFLTLDWIP